MNPSSFGFPEGLGNSSFSTTHVVDTVGASSLPENIIDPGNPTQPLAHSSPFAHESGNIPASLFPHMHTPSALLGHSIGQMVSSQVIHTTMVTQDTQPPSHTSHISTPYIGGQSSMGGQPSAGGKPSVAGKLFTGGKPTWLQHQQAWGKVHSCKSFYPYYHWLVSWTSISRSCESFVGSTQSDGHSSTRNYALSICKPHDSNATVPSITIYGRSIRQPHHIGGPSGQFQYVGGPSTPSQYMGGQTGQPPYMGGQPGKPPYMGGPSSFSSRHNLDMVLLVFPHNMVITSINNLTDNYHSWLR
jgi:hypothetical protein